MTTISRKNVSTLVEKYVKSYKEFDSYMKHCLNILKNYNWLKDSQFDFEISDSQYFDKLVNTIGVSHFSLFFLYKDYYKDIIERVPSSSIKNVKTNIYYLDEMSRISNIFDNLNDFNERIGMTSQDDEIQNIREKYNPSFCRMMYQVIPYDYDLEIDKEYTFNEIYNLVLDGKIVVLDSYIEKSDVTKNQLIDDIKSKKIVFVNSCVSENIENNSKIVSSFYDMNGKEQRAMWGIINMLFCRYVRCNSVGNSINCDKGFDATVNHILEIINGVKKYYKKRRKNIPKLYEELIAFVLVSVEKEKSKYERQLSNSFTNTSFFGDIVTNNSVENGLKLVKKLDNR